MPVSKAISLLSLLIFSTICLCGGDIYVSWDRGNDQAECGSASQPCRSLSYIVSERIVTNDSRILIEPVGTQLIDQIVKFQYIHNLAISSTADNVGELAIVSCACEAVSGCGLVFEYCQDISLEYLDVRGCSILHSMLSGLLYRAGNIIYESVNVAFDRVSITESTGTGLLIQNCAGNIDVTNSEFANNSLPYNLTRTDSNEAVYGGAGLVIMSSACENLTAETCNKSLPQAHYTIQYTSFHNNAINLTDLSDDHWLFSYGGGLGMLLMWNVTNNSFKIEHSNFTRNKASCGGGLVWHCEKSCSNNIVNVIDCLFLENSETIYSFGGAGMALGIAYHAGGEIPSNNNITVYSAQFISNVALYAAGVLIYSSALDLSNSFEDYNHIWFIDSQWESNSGTVSPAVEVEPDFRSQQRNEFIIKPYFTNCSFMNNTITAHYHKSTDSPSYTFNKEEGIFLISRLTVYFQGTNLFENSKGTALYIATGTAVFETGAQTVFRDNTGKQGGAVALIGYSVIKYKYNTEFIFVGNRANLVGGAIFVLRTIPHTSIASHSCFLQYDDTNVPFNIKGARFVFEDNWSDFQIANSIFVTTINPCRLACLSYQTLPLIEKTFTNESCIGTFYYSNDSNQIASEGSNFILHHNQTALSIIPGRKTQLPLEILDELRQNITNITTYQSTIADCGIKISPGFDFVANNIIEMTGNPGDSCNLTLTMVGFHNTGASFPVILSSCPPGYVTDPSGTICVCSSSQAKNRTYKGVVGCRETKGVALMTPGYWVGYILNDSNDTSNQNNLYISDCPMGFCRRFKEDSVSKEERYYELVDVPSKEALERVVCTENRHSTLCSQCKDGYSVYFHSNTKKCGDNSHCNVGIVFYVLSELLPITVLFLTIIWFDISLTTGTAYSLLFMVQLLQAMIVSVNGAIDFSPLFIRHIYTLIYNALNLDFFDIDELSYCLWKGANTLDMISMKYLSVVYSIVLVMCFIYAINHCSCGLKLKWCRKRTVHYSAIQGLTAFLVICYFQCCRITFLLLNRESPQGIGGKTYKDVVFWDGTLEYFHGRHLQYALPALLCMLVIVIPLPMVLFCDPFLIKLESYLSLHFSCVRNWQLWTVVHNKLKPLLDSFQGSFKDEYRFFSGIYFFYRVLILAVLVLARTALQFYFLLEAVLVILMTVQAILEPFQKKRDNIIALLIFTNMALINALTLRIYDIVSHSGYTTEAVLLQWIQMILIYIPLTAGAVWVGWKVWRWCKSSNISMSNKDTNFAVYDNDFPEELFDRSSEEIRPIFDTKN